MGAYLRMRFFEDALIQDIIMFIIQFWLILSREGFCPNTSIYQLVILVFFFFYIL